MVATATPQESIELQTVPSAPAAAAAEEGQAEVPPSLPPAFDIHTPVAQETSIAVQDNDQPTPEYSEPLLDDLSLIAELILTSTAPDYYSPTRPDRLEDKIPNLLFVNRVHDLNSKIAATKSIESSRIYSWSVYGVMFVSIVVWAALFGAGVVHYNLWVIPLANVIILFLIQPKRPKYIAVVKASVAEWSKTDAEQGINLIYSVKPDITFNANLYRACTIQFYEKLTFHGDSSGGMNQDLPTYSS